MDGGVEVKAGNTMSPLKHNTQTRYQRGPEQSSPPNRHSKHLKYISNGNELYYSVCY